MNSAPQLAPISTGSGQKFRIKLHANPAQHSGQAAIEEGWFKGASGNSNDFIYSRSRERAGAALFSRNEAISLVRKMREFGYEAEAEPPIHVHEVI